MLEFDRVMVDARQVDLSAKVTGITAVVGPNGAGKSTMLSLAAGGIRPDRGRISFDGATLAASGAFVPSHRRRFAYLEQRSLLFPHLSVLQNVAFGAERGRAVRELAAVGCGELADRRPRQLSGGQAQRVALARALAIDPALVLLDEPLSAMDAAVVPEMRQLLRERLAGRPALFATHDLLDVLTVADRVAVLVDGRIVEQGAVQDVLARPQTRFMAEFCGVNLLAGVATASGIDVAGVEIAGISAQPLAAGSAAFATVAPNAVALNRTNPGGSPRNDLQVVVEELERRGATVLVRTSFRGQRLSAELTAAAVAELRLVPGEQLFAVVKATQVNIYGR